MTTESTNANPVKKTAFSFRDFTREQKLVFFCLSLGLLSRVCVGSLTSPFFPPEGAKHGVSSSVIGMVFSVGSLISLFATPLLGPLIGVIGPKGSMSGGIFLSGLFMIIFGLLENVESKEWFVAGCFVSNALASLGGTAIALATFTYTAKTFPGNMNFVMGAMEMSAAVAEIIALACGGFLYDLGGYKLPFILFSTLHLLVIPLNLFLLPSDRNEGKDSQDLKNENLEMGQMEKSESKIETFDFRCVKPVNEDTNELRKKFEEKIPARFRLWHVFKIPRTVFMLVTFAMTGISWSFLASTLEPHLAPLNLSKAELNMMFILMSVLYGVFSPFWGWLADRVEKTWYIMAIGLIVGGITYCFLGPLPFLGLENTVWLNIVCLSIITVASGAASNPAIEATLLYTVEAGYEDNVATYGVVSSLIHVMSAGGSTIGSFCGGFLLEHLGFPMGAGVTGAVSVLWGALMLVYFLFCHNKPIPRKKNSDQTSPSGEPVSSEHGKNVRDSYAANSSNLTISKSSSAFPLHINSDNHKQIDIQNAECTSL